MVGLILAHQLKSLKQEPWFLQASACCRVQEYNRSTKVKHASHPSKVINLKQTTLLNDICPWFTKFNMFDAHAYLEKAENNICTHYNMVIYKALIHHCMNRVSSGKSNKHVVIHFYPAKNHICPKVKKD